MSFLFIYIPLAQIGLVSVDGAHLLSTDYVPSTTLNATQLIVLNPHCREAFVSEFYR